MFLSVTKFNISDAVQGVASSSKDSLWLEKWTDWLFWSTDSGGRINAVVAVELVVGS